MTLEHKYGETTLEKAPARVVCVGLTEQDALLALGIVPVGGDQVVRRRAGLHLPVGGRSSSATRSCPRCSRTPTASRSRRWPRSRPDLIIGQYSGLTKKDYELLSAIAPTVAQPGEYADYGAPWDEMAMNIAKAVGQPDEDAGARRRREAADRRRRPPRTRSSRG